MNTASYQIYRAFQDKAEGTLTNMLRKSKVVSSLRLTDKNGKINGVLRFQSRYKATKDGRIDNTRSDVTAELVLNRILHFCDVSMKIVMPASAGVTIEQRAEDYTAEQSLALLHELVEMPEFMENQIRPQIDEWCYSHRSGMLKAHYTESYRRPVSMGHNRLFTA